MMPFVEVNERAAKEIKRGALHVYAQNIVRARARNGDWVEVRHGGEAIAYGFYSSKSSIPVKVFSREERKPGELIAERMEWAHNWKSRIYDDVFRWIFGEGDLLPGLTVDRYGDVVVVRNNTFGLERYLDAVVNVIKAHGVDHVLLRGEGAARIREGLKKRVEWLAGRKERTVIEEGNARFIVDVAGGQKTGFYLDQRENRIELERHIGNGMRVLDVFASTGGFGIHAAVRGASVEFVELGKHATQLIRENLELNNVKGMIRQGDALEIMRRLAEKGKQYDVVILDPPALAKGRADIGRAKKMYFKINNLGIRLLKRGGLLVTCSCSHPITPKEFMGIVEGAAESLGRNVQMLGELRGQAPDHTVYLPQPETKYLKCMFAHIL